MRDLADLRAELDRVAVSYSRVGARDFVALQDMDGGIVWLMGPPEAAFAGRGCF